MKNELVKEEAIDTVFTYFKYECEKDQDTGNYSLKRILVSNGIDCEKASKDNLEKVRQVSKKTTGTENLTDSYAIISHVANGMPQELPEVRLNHAAHMLAILQPQNEMEALLYGQFLSLQESGLQCVRQANHQGSFYHEERLFLLGIKLLAQANATVQTLVKYRSGGQQTVQVVHLHNEGGRAIVAQSLPQTS
jgi:hypothetical protein